MGPDCRRVRLGYFVAFLAGCSPDVAPMAGGGSSDSAEASSSTGFEGCPDEKVWAVDEGELGPIIDDDFDAESLRTVTRIAGHVTVTGSIADLSFFECLRQIDGQLSIGFAQNLRTLEGLSNLEAVGPLHVTDNPRLESLAGLDSLREVELVYLRQNNALTALELGQMEVIERLDIGICPGGGNDALRQLDGFDALQRMSWLEIHLNKSLESVEALRELAERDVGFEHVEIERNVALPGEHVTEILSLFGPEVRTSACGNLGDPTDEESCPRCYG